MLGTKEKISIFKSFFTGARYVYGTYDLSTSKQYQVNKQVTDDVLHRHLSGKETYGFFPLFGGKTRVTVVDFKTRNQLYPLEFLNASKHYGLSAYIERNASKGYQVWFFFSQNGVPADKVRIVLDLIMDDIEKPDTEVLLKQNALNLPTTHRSLVKAPLFGALVLKKRTVFIDHSTFEPYENQWEFLKSVQRNHESLLDEIIELNELSTDLYREYQRTMEIDPFVTNIVGLPPCAQIMIQEGVSHNQRQACFRLAVHLKRLGLPLDSAVALLIHWSHKNKLVERRKTMITEKEIISQVSYAFKRNYSAYGCESDEVKPFCQPECPVNIARSRILVQRQS